MVSTLPRSGNRMNQSAENRGPYSGSLPRGHSAPPKAAHQTEGHVYVLNSLWTVWYGVAIIAFQVYIIARSVHRFTSYLGLPWPNGEPPYRELNAYVVLTGIGVVILPFFVVCTMVKIGNYANDGRKLGAKDNQQDRQDRKTSHPIEPIRESLYENFGTSTASSMAGDLEDVGASPAALRPRLFRLIWRHSMPTGPLLHACAALCFLIPKILIEAQLINARFYPKGAIWKSDMEFLFDHVPSQSGRLHMFDFLGPINSSDRRWLEDSMASAAMASAAEDQGHVWRTDSTAISGRRLQPITAKLDIEPGTMSPEFINFAIALFIIAIRYPSVFWSANKGFAFTFSLQILLNNLTVLVSISTASILYKLYVAGQGHVAVTRYTSQLPLMPLYLLAVLTSSQVIYYYGHQKYSEWRERRLHSTHIVAGRRSGLPYLPHFFAFIWSMLISVTGVPIVYELMICGRLNGRLLLGAAIIAIQLFLWLFLWLAFTVKRSWRYGSEPTDDLTKYSAGNYKQPESIYKRGPPSGRGIDDECQYRLLVKHRRTPPPPPPLPPTTRGQAPLIFGIDDEDNESHKPLVNGHSTLPNGSSIMGGGGCRGPTNSRDDATTIYGTNSRNTNMRMRSFTEAQQNQQQENVGTQSVAGSEHTNNFESFMKENALPPPPEPKLFSSDASPYGTYCSRASLKRPFVSIAPQVQPPPPMPPMVTNNTYTAMMNTNDDRDSANYSAASSGESEMPQMSEFQMVLERTNFIKI